MTHEPDAGQVTPYEIDLNDHADVAVARQVGHPGDSVSLPGAERLAGMA